MVVIVRSAPDTPEGRRGIRLARDMFADIVLVQNGVYFIQGQKLEDLGFTRTVYALEEDRRLRGLAADGASGKVEDITYDRLIDLMAESDKVLGMF